MSEAPATHDVVKPQGGPTTPARSQDDQPLLGVAVVSIAVNLPGPVAAARLASLGASVTKVEPPTGDPLALVCRRWYDELVRGQTVHQLDLKEGAGRARLHELLGSADLMITSHRAAGLERLGLGWADLQARHPRLCHIAIVGQPAPDDGLPGHDLTYQAAYGLLDASPDEAPRMPALLVADLGGAERAATEALAALVHRSRTGQAIRREVALTSAAEAMAAPLRHGLTTPGGPLRGALPAYRIYPAAVGHIALAALEPHFFARLTTLLGVSGTRAELEAAFATRSAAEWEEWARDHDLPLAAVVRVQAAR